MGRCTCYRDWESGPCDYCQRCHDCEEYDCICEQCEDCEEIDCICEEEKGEDNAS